MRLLLPLVLGVITSLSALGCNGIFGCEGAGPILDTDAVSAPLATATASEIPTCDGSTTAPRDYVLTVSTPSDAGAHVLFTVTIARTASIGTSTPLTVDDSDASPDGQTAGSADGTLHVSITPDADLDDTMVAAVVGTVDELPPSPENTVSVTLEVHYVDGRVFDQSFSATVTGAESCSVN